MQVFSLIDHFKDRVMNLETDPVTESFEEYTGLYRTCYGEGQFFNFDGGLVSFQFHPRSLVFNPSRVYYGYAPTGELDEFSSRRGGYDLIGEKLKFLRDPDGKITGFLLGSHEGKRITLEADRA